MIYLFLADGFEETEAIVPLDILKRVEVGVTTVGIGGRAVVGAHGIAVGADFADSEMPIPDDIDGVILPGGMPGTNHMDACEAVDTVLKTTAANGGYLAAICAAPLVLGKRGYLEGKNAVCYPGFEDQLAGAAVSETETFTVTVPMREDMPRSVKEAVDDHTRLCAESDEKYKTALNDPSLTPAQMKRVIDDWYKAHYNCSMATSICGFDDETLASRMVTLDIPCVRLGEYLFVGVPGESLTELATWLRSTFTGSKTIPLDQCNGYYSYVIDNPIIFYTKVCGNVEQAFTRDQIDEQMKTEFISALQPAFGALAEMELRPAQLPAKVNELRAAMNDALRYEWIESRGITVGKIALNPINLADEDMKAIAQMEESASYGSNAAMMAGRMTTATANAMETAAGNSAGAMTGFMGMGMAGGAMGGGFNAAQNFYNMGAQQMQQKQSENGWKCTCGTTATGNFCPNCGQKLV